VYSEDDYLSFIRKNYDDFSTGKKRITDSNELFSYINNKNLTSLENDFICYCLNQLLLNNGKFRYNDIIDYMNLSVAIKHSDCLLTLDDKFLKKIVSKFESVKTTKFYAKSLKLNQWIKIK
jgi:hypothetical protein